MEEAKSPSESIVNTVQKCIRLSVEALEPSLMVQETFHTAESSVESDEDAFSYEETDLIEADEPTEVGYCIILHHCMYVVTFLSNMLLANGCE